MHGPLLPPPPKTHPPTHLSRCSSSSSVSSRDFIQGSTRARVWREAVPHTDCGGSGYSSWSRSVPDTRYGRWLQQKKEGQGATQPVYCCATCCVGCKGHNVTHTGRCRQAGKARQDGVWA